MKTFLPKYKLICHLLICLLFFIFCNTFTLAQAPVSGINIVKNGDFSSVVAPDYPAQWKHTKSVVGKATYSVKSVENFSQNGGNVLEVFINRRPLQGEHALYQTGLKLNPNTTYNLNFKAGTDLETGAIRVKIYDNRTKKSFLLGKNSFRATRTPNDFALNFTTPSTNSPILADLLFQFEGRNNVSFILDDIELTQSSVINSQSKVDKATSPFNINKPADLSKPVSPNPSTALPPKARNCDIYVSAETGNDGNTGQTQELAVKSISKAISIVKNSAQDRIICIQNATYNESLSISGLKGTAERPYIIKSSSVDAAVISGQSYALPLSSCVSSVSAITDSCLRVPLVSVVDSEYVVLDGLHIRESSGVGLRLVNNSHVTLFNSKISDNASFGILITNLSPQTAIENTEVYNNFTISSTKKLPLGAGISIYSTKNNVNVSDITIKGSKIHNNIGDGVFIGPNTQNISIDTSTLYDNLKSNISFLNTQNTQIKRNLLYCSYALAEKRDLVTGQVGLESAANIVMSGSESAFSSGEVSQNLLVNNILANCPLNLTINAKKGQFTRNTLINNTFVSQTGTEQVKVLEGAFPISNNSLVNNLLIQPSSLARPSYVSLLLNRNILNRNLLISSQQGPLVTDDALTLLHEPVNIAQSTSSVELNPLQFKLPNTSKYRDFGTDAEMAPKDDFYGNTRTTLPEAGAIELNDPAVLGSSITLDTSLTTIPVSSCTKYVNKDGSETNGTTLETSYKTIQKGVQELQAGDVLCIKGGNYSEIVTISKKFTEAAKVKIGAYSGGESVTLTSGAEKLPQSNCANLPNLSDNSTQTDNLFKSCSRKGLINISEAENIELVGLTISDSSATGLFIVDSKNITLNSVNITKSGLYGALFSTVNSISITKSKFLENVTHRQRNSKVSASGLEMINDSQKLTISDSLIAKNLGDGLVVKNTDDIALHDSAIVDNAFTNFELRSANKFVINRTLIACSADGLTGIRSALSGSNDYGIGFSYFGTSKNSSSTNTIVNSILQGCKSNMILNAEGDKHVKNLQVLNNHFINARTTSSAKENSRNVLMLGSNYPNLKFKNNIIYQKDDKIRTIVGYNTKYDFTANILYPNTIRTLAPPAFIIQNPKLDDGNAEINLSNLNVSKFMPKDDSPAINTADARIESDYLKVDYLKEDRSNLDIGALEVTDADDDVNEDNDNDNGDDNTGDDGDDGDGDGDGDSGGDGEGDGDGDGGGGDDYDPCDYYWCDDDSSGDNDYDYDYDYDDSTTDEQGYDEYDPYADYYYDFDYDAGDTAQFGVIEPSPTTDVLKNGSFDLSKAQNGLPPGWFIRTGVDGAVKVNLVSNDYDSNAGNAMQIQLKRLPAAGKVELFQSGLPLKAGALYELSFVAKSDYGSDLDISLNNSVFPYEVLTNSLYGVDLKPDWNVYTGYIKIPETQNPNSSIRIVFSFDGAIDDLYFIDKVTMTEFIKPSNTYEDYNPDYDLDPEFYTEPVSGETPLEEPQEVPFEEIGAPQTTTKSTKIVYQADF